MWKKETKYWLVCAYGRTKDKQCTERER